MEVFGRCLILLAKRFIDGEVKEEIRLASTPDNPLRIVFEGLQSKLMGYHRGSIKIYNSNKEHREFFHYPLRTTMLFKDYISVEVYAGYQGFKKKLNEDQSQDINVWRVFKGAIYGASSRKEGGVNWVTEMQLGQGLKLEVLGKQKVKVEKGKTRSSVLSAVLDLLTGNAKTRDESLDEWKNAVRSNPMYQDEDWNTPFPSEKHFVVQDFLNDTKIQLGVDIWLEDDRVRFAMPGAPTSSHVVEIPYSYIIGTPEHLPHGAKIRCRYHHSISVGSRIKVNSETLESAKLIRKDYTYGDFVVELVRFQGDSYEPSGGFWVDLDCRYYTTNPQPHQPVEYLVNF